LVFEGPDDRLDGWRSQLGNGRDCFSSRRAGRIRSRSRSAKKSSLSWPANPFTLEFELLADAHFTTRAQARAAVAAFLDEYNNDRRHSSAGRLPPAVYETWVRAEQAA
jgi:transposase InsO family protein